MTKEGDCQMGSVNFSLTISFMIETCRTEVPQEKILQLVHKYAAYGHFGRRDIDAPWEVMDKAGGLRSEAGL